jgi:hypothetical protein
MTTNSEPVIRYEDLFSALVLPISKFRKLEEGEYQPIAAVGTGFTFGEQTLVTCWHCVRDSLNDDEVYAVAARSQGTDQQNYDSVFELSNLERDANGSDLALARIGFSVPMTLKLASEPAAWGEDVIACGYPMPLNTMDVKTKEPLINMNSSLFKGYVTRIRTGDFPGQPETRLYEMDMPAPPGMSGSPVFRSDSLEVVGVIVSEEGYEVPDTSRQMVFAYAHHLWVLQAAKGAATNNLPLSEYLKRAT